MTQHSSDDAGQAYGDLLRNESDPEKRAAAIAVLCGPDHGYLALCALNDFGHLSPSEKTSLSGAVERATKTDNWLRYAAETPYIESELQIAMRRGLVQGTLKITD